MNWQEQKNLLVQQSEANRRRLADDWRRVRSPKTWTNEAGNWVKRHPVLTTAFAAAVGALTVRAVRKRSASADGAGRLGKLASMAIMAWKFFRGKNSAS